MRSGFRRFSQLALGGFLATLGAVRAAWAEPTSPDTIATSQAKTPSIALDAQPATNGGDAESKARARQLYELGVQDYTEGRYYRAADHFLDAQRVFPTPQLAFNIAKAYDKAQDESTALRYYREYMRRAPDAPDAEQTMARVRELELALNTRGVQQLTILSTPEHATVVLDGQPLGVTPWTGTTWPGRHRLALRLEGFESTDDIVEVNAHRAEDVSIALSAQKPPVPPSANSSQDRSPKPEVATLTWLSLGGGLVALSSALALEMAAGDDRGITRTGAFLGGLGLSASLLGGVLLYSDLKASAPKTPKTPKQAWTFGIRGWGCHAGYAAQF